MITAALGAFDSIGFWQNLATLFATAAVWAQRRAAKDRDPVDELTARLRHPLSWSLRHPVASAMRRLGRRRAV